jgi:lysophospholipase L1-like esterase
MGIADFQIPTIDTPGIGRRKVGGKTATPLIYNPATGSIAPEPLGVESAALLSNRTLYRPYNNLGVPGATAYDLMHACDSNTSQSKGNGYFNIVLRGGLFNNSSMLRQAIRQKPSVLTMWIGNNEILGGITAGTVVKGATVVPVEFYSAVMDSALDTLLRETSARIFLANIPSITSIPFVTTVPKVVFDPATFQPHPSNTPFLTKEDSVEYILLPALAEIAAKKGIPAALGGTGDSLPAGVTLSKAEVATANELVDAYNAYLRKKADDNPSRITLVDVNALLQDLTDGKISGLSSNFILVDPGRTAFSLDGVHPNAKGYREVTNLFISTINRTLNKSYPQLP